MMQFFLYSGYPEKGVPDEDLIYAASKYVDAGVFVYVVRVCVVCVYNYLKYSYYCSYVNS